MVVIMGLDLATNSGWAVRDPSDNRSATKCGVISVSDYDWEEKYAMFALQFLPLVRQYKPDFIAIEQPEHGVRQFKKKDSDQRQRDNYVRSLLSRALTLMSNRSADSKEVAALLSQLNPNTINPGALQLSGIAGAAAGVSSLMDIPFGTIIPSRWRKHFYVDGFKAPRKMVRDQKTGQLKDEGADWKEAAINECIRMGVVLPSKKSDQRDAAEAVGVCLEWEHCDVPSIEWMQKRFIDLRTGAARAAKAKKSSQLSLLDEGAAA